MSGPDADSPPAVRQDGGRFNFTPLRPDLGVGSISNALGRPKNRLVAENQQAMEELRAWMDAQPPP